MFWVALWFYRCFLLAVALEHMDIPVHLVQCSVSKSGQLDASTSSQEGHEDDSLSLLFVSSIWYLEVYGLRLRRFIK